MAGSSTETFDGDLVRFGTPPALPSGENFTEGHLRVLRKRNGRRIFTFIHALGPP